MVYLGAHTVPVLTGVDIEGSPSLSEGCPAVPDQPARGFGWLWARLLLAIRAGHRVSLSRGTGVVALAPACLTAAWFRPVGRTWVVAMEFSRNGVWPVRGSVKGDRLPMRAALGEALRPDFGRSAWPRLA